MKQSLLHLLMTLVSATALVVQAIPSTASKNDTATLFRRQESTTGVAGCTPSTGTQFVTGPCKTSSECASGCCVDGLGVCRNVLALNLGKAGLAKCGGNTDGKICTK